MTGSFFIRSHWVIPFVFFVCRCFSFSLSSSKKNYTIGDSPSAIGVNEDTGTIYVANDLDDTVSVIDGRTNTVVGKPIPVGDSPSAIGVNEDTGTIYVANRGDGTVSVIDGTTHTVGKPIPVGKAPQTIGVTVQGTIYVGNSNDHTVSVIDGKNNTVVGKAISLGNIFPEDIGISMLTIYVAGCCDNSVYVIDGAVNKVVAKVMFNIKPFNSGYVVCDNTTDRDKWNVPLQRQFYIYSGSGCTAKPYPGFEFVSWQENIGGNSTQLIKLSSQPSIWESILDILHTNPDKQPDAKLNITKFGYFTANFKELPPPIPPEYVATLFTVLATALIGSWLTPTIMDRMKARTQRKYVKECISQIGKLDKNVMEDKIIQYYVDGKLSEAHRQLLKDKISEYYGSVKGSESGA